jgi:hypothetical protein
VCQAGQAEFGGAGLPRRRGFWATIFPLQNFSKKTTIPPCFYKGAFCFAPPPPPLPGQNNPFRSPVEAQFLDHSPPSKDFTAKPVANISQFLKIKPKSVNQLFGNIKGLREPTKEALKMK